MEMVMERRIRDLSLLTEKDRQRVLVEWNRTDAVYPETTLIGLFEEQALRTPQAVALEAGPGRQQMTYSDLNRSANQAAHYLRKLGVGPEVRVGICMDRSPELVAGLLGILKAGGAYLPLDPGYPRERLEFMVNDGQAAVVLTQQQFADRLGSHRAHVVCQEEKWADINKESAENPGVKVDPWNLAYVIYTSGSTGKPKGVGIVHENASVLMHWAREVYTKEELDGVLASTSICFDLSVFEIFVPLSWGGKVLLGRNALDLPQWKGTDKVKLVNTVPSAIGELVRMKGIPDSVKTINLAGEALHRSLVEQIYEQRNIARVCNLYGPSEDTTYSTYAGLKREDGGVTIGRPIAKTRIYVLDREFQPAPAGVAGELYIAGSGLARGYLNRPDLTAERFVPNPFADGGAGGAGGQRMYKTGDKARWNRNGELEFLGRFDHQVKLRGFRIELGEIESALLRHPGVQEAVVMVREVAPRDKRLVAYVVTSMALSSGGDELKKHIQDSLPEYMVPSHVVRLDKMPLTPNGKMNRAALPLPDRALARTARRYAPPRDAMQEKLVRLWEELLVARPIGIEDDFFEIGGHSMLATRLIAKIQQQTGRNLPLAAVFDGPTIQQISQLLRQAPEAPSWSPLVPIQPGGQNPPLFIVHSADGDLRSYAALGASLAPDQPLYGLRSRSTNPDLAPHGELEAMAAEYAGAIRAFRPAGPYFIGGWSSGGVIAFEIAKQLRQQGQDVASVVLIDAPVLAGAPADEKSSRARAVKQFIEELGLMETLRPSWDEIGALPPTAQLNRLWSEAAKAGVIAHELPFTDFRRRFESFKTSLEIALNYSGGPYQGRVALFKSGKFSENGNSGEAQGGSAGPDSARGWGRLAAGGVEVHETPGDHFSMLQEPHVKALALGLRDLIAQSLAVETAS